MMDVIKLRITSMMVALLLAGSAAAQEIETFVEPYRAAALSTTETGVLEQIVVRDGSRVQLGQTLAWLNDDVLHAALKVADAGMRAKAALKIAEKRGGDFACDYLKVIGHYARTATRPKRELERSQSDYMQAQARLENVREELAIRVLEHARVQMQIEQRKIRAPFEGIIIRVDKEVGEQVSPTDPVVLHLVQIKTLKALFSVPVDAAHSLRPGHVLRLSIGNDRESRNGVIEHVSAVADAKSGTVSVTVRIPNAEGKIQSGLVCRWDLKQQANNRAASRVDAKRRAQ